MWGDLKKAGEAAVRLVRNLLVALVVMALVAGTSWVVTAWQVTQERFDRQREVDALRTEFAAKLDGVVAAQSGAAGQAGEPDGGGEPGVGGADATAGAGVSAGAGGAGVGVSPGADAAFKESVERRLSALEEAVRQGLGQKLEEEQRLALSLQVKTLLLKAKSEVLEVQLDLVEDNRGQARHELELAGATMAEVIAVAPAAAKADLTDLADLIDQARVDLLVGAPTATDRVSLAWHRLGVLIGDFTEK